MSLRPVCGPECAPDCAERIDCPEAGAPGHTLCGWCEVHDLPWHRCITEHCPECFAPDNCGDCDHTPLTPEQLAQLKP